ncbi:MAG TPA: hypothetical protein VIT42_16910 [Microlunatus sp.]
MPSRRILGDWVIAVAVAATQLIAGLTTPPPATNLDPLGYLLGVAGGLALVVRRRAPVIVLAVTGACALGYVAMGFDVPALAYLIAVYAAVRAGHRVATAVCSAVMLVAVPLALLASPSGGPVGEAVAQARDVLPPAWLIAAGVAGEALRQAERRTEEAERSREETGRLGCLRGISTLTGFALAVEMGDWTRFSGASIGAFVGLTPSEQLLRHLPQPRIDHQDRQRPCPKAAGRGSLAPPPRLPTRDDDVRPVGTRCCSGAGTRRRRKPQAAPPMAAVHRPQEARHHRCCRHRPRAGRLVLVLGHPRRGCREQIAERRVVLVDQHGLASRARSDPRLSYEPPRPTRDVTTLDTRHADSSSRTAPSCRTQPANIS